MLLQLPLPMLDCCLSQLPTKGKGKRYRDSIANLLVLLWYSLSAVCRWIREVNKWEGLHGQSSLFLLTLRETGSCLGNLDTLHIPWQSKSAFAISSKPVSVALVILEGDTYIGMENMAALLVGLHSGHDCLEYMITIQSSIHCLIEILWDQRTMLRKTTHKNRQLDSSSPSLWW